jgi:hypothetical protein
VFWSIELEGESRRGFMVFGELADEIRLCDTKEYRCFSMLQAEKGEFKIEFAVKSTAIRAGDEWRIEDRIFKVKESLQLRFMGRSIEAFLIERNMLPNDKHRVRFLFSQEAGLIAMEFTRGSEEFMYQQRFLLLEQPCGFGAPPSCSRE